MSANRWSYKVVHVKPSGFKGVTPERVEEELRPLGLQGWELVNAVGHAGSWAPVTLYLRRPQ